MIKQFFLMIGLTVIVLLSQAQDIEGIWYETSSNIFDLMIDISDKKTGSTYVLETRSKKIVDAPLQKVEIQNDQLAFMFESGGYQYLYTLQKDGEELNGHCSLKGHGRFAVTFSRNKPDKPEGPAKEIAKVYTRQDTLRGAVTSERAWWDIAHYWLDLAIDIEEKSFVGSNTITYQVNEPYQVMQVDLQEPLRIVKVVQYERDLQFTKDGSAYFIQIEKEQEVGSTESIQIFYEGIPQEAKRAPWDGGITWSEDKNGKPWIASSCQGVGASLWWPCKDHMYDEPDSMMISVTVPDDLMAVSNGRLINSSNNADNTSTFHWEVKNPINNYGVSINIADYGFFEDSYAGEKGKLDCEYYVLKNNLSKARAHFKQVHMMLEAFEHWFGPYPFYEDGFKLVETPFLGMEHQSAIAYGNYYMDGYLGRDGTNTGWGLKFDYIIIHEAGHEWFANNITYADIADLWIHEGFTTYSESLYLEYHFGKKAAYEYLEGMRRTIHNDKPMIGNYDVNDDDYTGDVYDKGALMLHTLRQVVDDDERWRQILRKINATFYHQTVSTRQIEDFLSQEVGRDLSGFFDQYLCSTQIPTLEYFMEDGVLAYRWINVVPGFDMPLKIKVGKEEIRIYPESKWTYQHVTSKGKVSIDPAFYVAGYEGR